MLPTLPRPGSGLQTVPGTGPALPCVPAGGPEPDPAVFADAVARYRALERLRGFRQSLYECLDARADALFELADAVLCADHAVTSLVQLCLEPEFTRGHGALYDALSAGRIDDERFFSLLASELPRASTSSGAPTSPGSTSSTPSSTLKGTPRPHRREGRGPLSRPTAGSGSSWPRTPSSCSPGPWPPASAAPGRNSPIPPGRWPRAGSAGGFATSAATWGHPPVSRNPPAPGPAGPKAAAKAQLPATFSPAKPTCRAQQKRR